MHSINFRNPLYGFTSIALATAIITNIWPVYVLQTGSNYAAIVGKLISSIGNLNMANICFRRLPLNRNVKIGVKNIASFDNSVLIIPTRW